MKEEKEFNIDLYIEELKRNKILNYKEIKHLCKISIEYFSKMNNIIEIKSPLTVCGDIHGQYKDLLELLEIGGKPEITNYLFLGDYVDRGYCSIETIELMLCLSIKYKENFNILRGNHESRTITQCYGFYDECLRKYKTIEV